MGVLARLAASAAMGVVAHDFELSARRLPEKRRIPVGSPGLLKIAEALMRKTHRPRITILMLSLAAAYSGTRAATTAGVAHFAAGDANLQRGNSSDPLARGRSIESGDMIVTGPNGQAQIRFTDGSLVSLRPNTQFRVTEYADTKDPNSDRYFMDFLRGGMRAISGLIGKRNPANYKVTTSTAPIGIRGSAFNLEYNPDGSLSGAGEKDEIVVCTVSCIGIRPGEQALVKGNREAPIRTNATITLNVPGLRQDPGVVANNVN